MCLTLSIEGDSNMMSQLSIINLIMFKENICIYTPNIKINKSLLTTILLLLLFLLHHLSFMFALERSFLPFFPPPSLIRH